MRSKIYVLLLMLLAIPFATATSVTREISKESIRAEGSASAIEDYFIVDVLLTVNVDSFEPMYFIRENLPDGVEVVYSDLPIINSNLLSVFVYGSDIMNITYRYTLKDATGVQRGNRIYGDYMTGSNYLGGYTDIAGEQLFNIVNIKCNTNADTDSDGKIDKHEKEAFKSLYRSGKISLSELSRMFYEYMNGGC